MNPTTKTALVTGGGRRIGAAIVRALHDAGANVVIHCNRSRDDAEALADGLNALRAGSAAVEQANLLEDDAHASLVHRAQAHWGGLDVLVNNASTFYPTPMGSVHAAQWDDLMGSNLRAPFFLSQAAAPFLKQRQGVIINIVDVHAQRPMKGHPVYCAAKAGLAMLTLSLARELGPEVRVNGVAPGAVMWPENDISDAIKAEVLEATALKRAGAPEDVAGAVRYLALEAGYVTGQILSVDGGRSLSWS